MTARAILHVDMDAFYASVEQRDHPELLGQPVIVGGTGKRGVVAAASYEAREFGVHSAMPASRARQRCPDGVYVRPRMDVYQSVSRQVFAVFRRYTPLVEGLSLDEAFLDVTDSQTLHGNAVEIGRQIRQDIADELSLAASVGLAPNKFVAKLASDARKPNGYCVVRAHLVQQFLDPLPVKRMWGIGKKTLPGLTGLGIRTIGDLRRADPLRLQPVLGNRTEGLQRLARGIDDRPVKPGREDKSISSEVTVENDLLTLPDCQQVLARLADEAVARVRRKQLGGRTITIKIRSADFRTWTRSLSLAGGTAETGVVVATAQQLMTRWWQQLGPLPIRLLGVGLSNFVEEQNDLFGRTSANELDRLTDVLRQRYGADALRSARLLHPTSNLERPNEAVPSSPDDTESDS